ncbi:MAG: hypothetical protein A4E28_02262 [Methanocella sp. PtaU1.Bin125]|nr:MAG: hypothetical protein A4E28_02262 [Methanocella sp. PtaU1.Bin125]
MMGVPRPIGQDPRRYTTPIKMKLRELASQMRDDLDKVDDEKARALLETSAEVILGLIQAFEDYEAKNEAAWR